MAKIGVHPAITRAAAISAVPIVNQAPGGAKEYS
jgi:hypothetical protein